MKNFLITLFVLHSINIKANHMYQEKMKELIAHAKEHNPRYPFAAMIVDEHDNEICRGVNAAAESPIYHGEIVTINNCISQFGRKGLDWSKLTLITTAEPCPMCQGAIVWSGIKKVVYGTSIKTLIAKGWNQIDIPAEEISRRSNFSQPEITPHILCEETDELFIDLKNSNSELP